MACLHERQRVKCDVIQFEDRPSDWIAEISLSCDACGAPFRFLDVPILVSTSRASVSIDRLKLSVPIRPGAADIKPSGEIPVDMAPQVEPDEGPMQ